MQGSPSGLQNCEPQRLAVVYSFVTLAMPENQWQATSMNASDNCPHDCITARKVPQKSLYSRSDLVCFWRVLAPFVLKVRGTPRSWLFAFGAVLCEFQQERLRRFYLSMIFSFKARFSKQSASTRPRYCAGFACERPFPLSRLQHTLLDRGRQGASRDLERAAG